MSSPPPTGPLPEVPLLTAEHVSARHNLKDKGNRRAREIMREAGGVFRPGRYLVVPRENLLAWEREQAEREAALCAPSSAQGSTGSSPSSGRHTGRDVGARGASRRAGPSLAAGPRPFGHWNED